MPTSKERRTPYDGPVHESVFLTPPFRDLLSLRSNPVPVAIDVDMAPLILACWKLGWHTAACCQGRRDIKRWVYSRYAPAYVLFRDSRYKNDCASLKSAAAFVAAANRANVGPQRYWTQWRFHFDPRPPYGHSVYFKPAFIEAITIELQKHK